VDAVDHDWAVRQRAFRFVEELSARHGDVLPYRELQRGFLFDDELVSVVGMPGIWKPRQLDLPVSIRTGIDDPYGDEIDASGFLSYRYFKSDPGHPDNAGLRRCMHETRPLIYFRAVAEGRYVAVWPVYIVSDDPGSLTFTAACDDPAVVDPTISLEIEKGARRRYAAHVAMTRLHQAKFRQQVLTAYRHRCTLCRLKHDGLLDAAHILGDRHERGDPVVSNGLAMCKIHHAAFDNNILGIRPDHLIEINSKVLEERDGPMLRHGIQEMHGGRLVVLPRRPDQRPDPERLEERYEQFRAVG